MNKKGLKLALTALLAVSQAFALSEVRTPWIAGNGPLRYMFEKHDENEKYALNLWSAAHTKYANRAFTKNGFKTKEITELIFNKSSFAIGDAFPDRTMSAAGTNFNPLVAAKTIDPRVDYSEMGMTLGGEISMPIGKSSGRIGIRGSVPFRSIEMERLDSGLDKAEDPKADFVASKIIRVTTANNGNAVAANTQPATLAKAYNVGMLRQLRGINNQELFTNLDAAGAAQNGLRVFSTQIAAATPADAATNFAALTCTDPNLANKPAVYGYSFTTAATDVATSTYAAADVTDLTNAFNVPTTNANIRNIVAATNYADIFDVATAGGKNFANKKDDSWLIFRRSQNGTTDGKFFNTGAGLTLSRGIDQALEQYTENAYGFLGRNNYSLDTQNRIGMGDIDLDVFYDHQLHEDWNAEAFVGLRLPTGDSKDKFGTPYRALLGNGEHFEVKLGGMLAWQPLTWMNVKADASYSFVLESKENRMAVFAGSTIKNFGPEAAADVDWGYFKGHFDMNFFHPKTSDIRSTLGYEFYYKTQDNVSFKSSTATPFDGNPVAQALDNKLAEANTESMAHKVRFETSYQLSQYLELFCGGSFTFAGQNVMRDADTHGGFNVRF